MKILTITISVLILFYFISKLAQKPKIIIYILALVVSIVGINIHLGVTFYISRIALILFFISLLFNPNKNTIKPIWIQLPIISLIIQLFSVLLSDQKSEGLRQMFIYLSLSVIFLIIILVAKKTEIIIKAINYYLFIGIVQGLYGVYQVFGGVKGWPTYQTLMVGIPMANDRTTDGYFYTGAYSAFRAIGFFSSDVSHYAGYMAGILLIALSLIAYDKKKIFPYVVLIIGIIGLLFSLSRSGIIAFIVFGIPSLIYLLRKFDIIKKINLKRLFFISSIIISFSILYFLFTSKNEDIQNPITILTSRFENIFDVNSSKSESMSDHLLTRQLGLDAFLNSPLIGVGLGVNAAPWYSEKLHAYWAGSHSYHIDMLGQIGLLGLLTEWILMFLIVKYMYRGLMAKASIKNKAVLCGLLSSYIAIIFGNFLYYYYLNDFVWFIMGTGVALSNSIQIEEKKYIESQKIFSK